MLITDHSSVSENAAWQIIRDGYDAADETNLETVFTLSNGYSHVFLPIEKVRPQAILKINSGGKLKRSDPQMQSCSPVEAVFSTVNLDADGVCLQWDMSDAQENTQNLLNTHGRSIYQAVGNYPYQELQVWMNHRVFSIEPKLHIDLEPGQEKRWETVYTW